MKLTLLTRRLDHGGAQRQVVVLARGLQRSGRDVSVVSFFEGGALEDELRDAGVPLRTLGKRGRFDVAGFGGRLLDCLRAERPDVTYSFLVLANVASALLRPWLPPTRLVWGLRGSSIDPARYPWPTRVSMLAEERLALRADRVIVNSHAGRLEALHRGFPEERLRVVHNGIDGDRFRPDAAGRKRLRDEWGVAEHEELVGLVARLDPMKDHRGFLRAAARLSKLRPLTRFVCVGGGPADELARLQDLARALGLSDRLRFAGDRADLPACYSALDLHVSSSIFGEGFSNAVAEGMACGCPTVVTDVGDSALIVGELGAVVAPRDPEALARAADRLLHRAAVARGSLQRAARERILAAHGVERLVEQTLAAIGPVGPVGPVGPAR